MCSFRQTTFSSCSHLQVVGLWSLWQSYFLSFCGSSPRREQNSKHRSGPNLSSYSIPIICNPWAVMEQGQFTEGAFRKPFTAWNIPPPIAPMVKAPPQSSTILHGLKFISELRKDYEKTVREGEICQHYSQFNVQLWSLEHKPETRSEKNEHWLLI